MANFIYGNTSPSNISTPEVETAKKVYFIMDRTTNSSDISYQTLTSTPVTNEVLKELNRVDVLARLGSVKSTLAYSILDVKKIYNDTKQEKSDLNLLANDITSFDPDFIVVIGSEASSKVLPGVLPNELYYRIHSIMSVPSVVVPDLDMYKFNDKYRDYRPNQECKILNEVASRRCSEVLDGTYSDINDDYELHVASTYDELVSLYNKYLDDDSVLTLDYESNAIFPMHDGFEIIGFSLACRDSNNELHGVYASLKSLEYSMSEDDISKCFEFLKDKVSHVKDRSGKPVKFDYVSKIGSQSTGDHPIQGTVIVHNSNYERPATLHQMNYMIPYSDFNDTMVMSKLMQGGKRGAGLKYQAQLLGYPDWEVDLHRYIDYFRDIVSAKDKDGILRMVLSGEWNDRLLGEEPVIDDYKDSIDEFVDLVMSKGKPLKAQRDLLNSDSYEDKVTGISSLLHDRSSYKRRLGVDELEGSDYYDHYIKMLDLIEYFKIFNNTSLKDTLNKLLELLGRYYESSELMKVLECMSVRVKEARDTGLSTWTSIIPYNWVPFKLLTKYGAIDSVATYHLADSMFSRFVSESTDQVNLFKGYEVYLQQQYMGTNMELSGMKWDEKLAREKELNMMSLATNALKDILLINDQSTRIFLLAKVPVDTVADMIMNDDFWMEYFRNTFYRYPVIHNGRYYTMMMTPKEDKFGVVSGYDEKRISIRYLIDGGTYKGFTLYSIYNIMKGIPGSEESYEDAVLEYIYDDIRSATDPEYLKKYLNPNSSSGSDFESYKRLAEKHIMTERFRKVHVIRMVSEASINIGTRTKEYKKYKRYIDACNDFTDLRRDYENPEDPEKMKFIQENHVRLRTEKFDDMMSMVNELIAQFYDEKYVPKYAYNGDVIVPKDIPSVVSLAMNVPMPGLDDTSMIWFYHTMKYYPVDNEDVSTWLDDMKWMYNLRIFKKCVKIVSTYLNGSIGRGSVYTVDKDVLESGNPRLIRKIKYKDLPKDDDGNVIVGENDSFLVDSKFGINSAETGRWTSGWHTIPSGSDVKTLYTSRYKGGTIFMPDFSQNEVRTLSTTANVEPMLEAFRNGEDIHMSNARRIYQKQDVSSTERRYAKTATFHMLYGGDSQSFANSYLHGDIDLANDIFDKFIRAFPTITTWKNERIEEAEKYGRVSLLTNRFIKMDMPNKDTDPRRYAEATRQCGNYPIQGASSDIAICTAFGIQEEIDKLNEKTKFFLFIHDSLESDCYPYELISQLGLQQKVLAHYPKDKFDVVCAADMAFGYSLGHEVELESIDSNDDNTEATIVMKGYQDEIEDTVNNWSRVYSVVDTVDSSYKDSYTPIDELFIPKHAYNPWIGKHRGKGECTVHLKY